MSGKISNTQRKSVYSGPIKDNQSQRKSLQEPIKTKRAKQTNADELLEALRATTSLTQNSHPSGQLLRVLWGLLESLAQ
jgi:hypothetical protein